MIYLNKKMNNLKKLITNVFAIGVFLALFIFSNINSKAQNIHQDIDSLDLVSCIHHFYDTICQPDSIMLGVIPPGGGNITTSYTISTIPYNPDSYVGNNCFSTTEDDEFTACLPIGFTFCFYGNSYTQCLCSSNGILQFDCTNASNYCQWPISAAIPSTSDPENCVMGPWEDLQTFSMANYLPALQYATLGCAPYRRFVFSINNEAYYSCSGENFKGQIVLYESTNIIDILIDHKPQCSTGWNGSYAIEGLHNATGTLATVVPGRNYPTVWTVTTPECHRFTPTSTPAVITWTGPNIVSTQNGPNIWSIVANPTATATYIASQTMACSGQSVADTFTVVFTYIYHHTR